MTELGTYETACFSCGETFDALAAGWCSCLNKERTLKCPHCRACFCVAPKAVKQKFWANAPEALWARKREEATRNISVINAPPDSVPRPLVLVVDDEKEVQQIALRTITELGYGVVIARNGEEGLQMAKEYRPQIVLTDAMMPKLDGREMARRLKEDADLPNMKVVVMTSLYTDPHYKHEALKKFKVDAYIAKPIDRIELGKVLRKMILPR